MEIGTKVYVVLDPDQSSIGMTCTIRMGTITAIVDEKYTVTFSDNTTAVFDKDDLFLDSPSVWKNLDNYVVKKYDR